MSPVRLYIVVSTIYFAVALLGGSEGLNLGIFTLTDLSIRGAPLHLPSAGYALILMSLPGSILRFRGGGGAARVRQARQTHRLVRFAMTLLLAQDEPSLKCPHQRGRTRLLQEEMVRLQFIIDQGLARLNELLRENGLDPIEVQRIIS